MKTIVTHISPDLDAIAAIWLIKRYHTGWEGAAVKFVPAGETLDGNAPDEDPNTIHVDTGLGRFDHHQHNRDTCAAKELFEFLVSNDEIKAKTHAPLSRLVEVVNDFDHFREVELPTPDRDIYNFLVTDALDGLRPKTQDDRRIVEMGELMLDGVLQTLANKVHAEQEIKEGLIFESSWGRSLAMETENEEAVRLAQKKGYRLVIRKSKKKGHVRIKLTPTHTQSLKKVYDKLRAQDANATWYYHPSGHMILNGSAKNPDAIPTTLTLDEVVKTVKDIK